MSERATLRRFVGGMIMAIGGSIILLCGLCTGFFAILAVAGALSQSRPFDLGNALSALVLPLSFGFVPIVFGLVIFFAGRNLYRNGKPLAVTDADQPHAPDR